MKSCPECHVVGLNPAYWYDSAMYCKAAETKISTPTLFDLDEAEEVQNTEEERV